MIFINGVAFPSASSSSSPLLSTGSDALIALMNHPFLVSIARSLKFVKEAKFSFLEEFGLERSSQRKLVYVFQREYATADPALVDLVGTDEATTCVGLVLRNRESGMISIAHMDFPAIVENGFDQMLSLLDCESDSGFDVHLLGAFEDDSPKPANHIGISESTTQADSHSFSLCMKIVETMERRPQKFHIQTFFVLGHNTRIDFHGISQPIFNGFMVKMNSGSLIPARFDKSTRCPDETVRRIRVSTSFNDPNWSGNLLDTYDTKSDTFVIAPCSWSRDYVRIALILQELSDEEILLSCSTSPAAEGPEFVDNERRMLEYLIKHPDWHETFRMRRPRVFERIDDGCWKMCEYTNIREYISSD